MDLEDNETISIEDAREMTLAAFYAKQIDEDMDKLWESGEWNEQKLESLSEAHLRIPYK